MSDDEVVYNDEANYISWLKLVQLVQFDMVLDPESPEEVEYELDRRAVGFNPNDEVIVRSDEGFRSVDAEPDAEVSQHDWVSSQTKVGHSLQVALDGMSDCGKPLTECGDFSCKHETWVKSAEWLPQIRDEFKTEWTSLSDRPTENDKFGLPGLRYIEKPDRIYFSLNAECPSCHIYTPRKDSECQNCESNLVSI